MAKTKPVKMELPVKELKELYREAVSISQVSVVYDQDQLQMANQAIFQMRATAERIAIYLYNKGILNTPD